MRRKVVLEGEICEQCGALINLDVDKRPSYTDEPHHSMVSLKVKAKGGRYLNYNMRICLDCFFSFYWMFVRWTENCKAEGEQKRKEVIGKFSNEEDNTDKTKRGNGNE